MTYKQKLNTYESPEVKALREFRNIVDEDAKQTTEEDANIIKDADFEIVEEDEK